MVHKTKKWEVTIYNKFTDRLLGKKEIKNFTKIKNAEKYADEKFKQGVFGFIIKKV
jgi:hypothetical protein